MVDHHDLVAEMPSVERMSTQERLKHAKKRRIQQLKKFSQYEKQLEKESSKKRKSGNTAIDHKPHGHKRNVIFVPNISLLEAATRKDVDEVGQLLAKGVNPDLTNDDGLTALHQCCIDDSEQMLVLLLEYGANVNAQDSEQWTPLHAAATCGHAHLCKHLVDSPNISSNHPVCTWKCNFNEHNGIFMMICADLLAVNADGNMPYDICEDERTLDYIETEMAKRGITQEEIDDKRLASEKYILEDLEKKADTKKGLEFRDHIGATPLHIAAANGYLKVAEYLLDNRVAVNVKDYDSWQPIHAAAYWGHPDLVDILVQHGADIDAKTKNGETPFDLCEDPELKQKILDVKDEIETSKAGRHGKSTAIKHRISSRSASIRRSSLRGDKGRLSLKEAKEEALHFGLRMLQDEEDIHEMDEDKENVPATNIDDVEIILEVEDPHNYKERKSQQKIETRQEHFQEPVKNPFQAPVAKPTPAQAKPAPAPVKPLVSVKPSPAQLNPSIAIKPAPVPVKKTVEEPAPKQVTTSQKAIQVKTDNESVKHQAVIQPTSDNKSEQTRLSDNQTKSTFVPPNEARITETRPHPRAPPTASSSGSTLNDLKRHRAENRRDTIDAHVQSMFVERANNWQSPAYSPGTNEKTVNGHNNNNNPNSYTQEPVHRFVAPANIAIIGEDEKQNCCVLM